MTQASSSNDVQAAELKVELESAALRKELRLWDLVGIQILNIVGLFWIGTAGKLGASHVMFWLPAMLLFYVPSGIVVAHLVQEVPLEGGLYQWAKLRFNPLIGFLVAMNLWISNLFLICKTGVILADSLANVFSPGASRLLSSSSAVSGLTVLIILGLMLLAWRGLSLGKWVNNFGSAVIVFLFMAMIAAAVPRWWSGTATVAPFALTLPSFSLLNLNLLGKMGYGAFSGVDGVGVFAGECRATDVAKPIRQSVWIAGPLISLMFIVGTASVLAFVKPDSIDLVSPMSQVLSLGAPSLVGVSVLLFAAATLSGNALGFSLMVRFPMVAGWDHILPKWFSRLDPRYRTPVGSLLFAGAVGMLFSVLANAGTGSQEAFQLLDNSGGILSALSYLVMFAIPLMGRGEKPPMSVRIAASSGFLMTLLYVTLSVFPIIDVPNPLAFTAKVVAVVGFIEVAGAIYYARAMRSRLAVI